MVAVVAIAVTGVLLFHFFGNATRGYVKTTSMFWWWISQWLDPNAETEHGWLVLALSGWVWWRNVREANVSIADRGLRIADSLRSGDGDRSPIPENLKSDSPADAARTNPQSAIRDPQLKGPQSAIRNWSAMTALLAGLALHVLGFVAQQTRVSIVAFLIFTWGVVRLAGGRRWGNAAMFPLAFMVFAIPVSVLDEIGLPLRLWVTSAGETIARLAGIDIVRNGTQLVAPDGRFNYDVAAPCSGVRSLMALTALSVLVGYLNFRSWWRRGVVFALCFPLVYLGNVARIVAIVFAAQAGGAGWGDRAHVVMGYGVFVIVLGGLLVAVAAIHRWWPETGDRRQETGDGRQETGDGRWETGDGRWEAGGETGRMVVSSQSSWTMIAIGALVVALTIGEMVFLNRIAQMPPRGGVGVVLAPDGLNPVELPAFLGTDWIGQRTEVSPVEREILPADTGYSRKNYAFVGDRTRDVFLSIVLSGRDRTSIHRPELCLVGQGWTIEGALPQNFRAPAESADSRAGEFRVTVLRVRREIPSAKGKVVVPQLVAYWFVGGDVIVASHWQRFIHDVWNRVFRARTDRWAYVLMQTDARDGEAAALVRMQAVLNGTLPVFQRPDVVR
jgi:exosortase